MAPVFHPHQPKKLKAVVEELHGNKDDPFELKVALFCMRPRKLIRIIMLGLMIILNIAGFLYSLKGKYILYTRLTQFSKAVLVVNILSEISLLLVSSFGASVYIRNTELVDVLRFLYKNDAHIIRTNNGSKLFTALIYILRVQPFFQILLGGYFLWLYLGWSVYRYYIPREIWFCNLNFIICSFTIVANKIKDNFTTMNIYLEELHDKTFGMPVVASIPSRLNIMEISRRYNILCNTLDAFNKISKPHLVCMIICITLNILYNLVFIIEFTLRPHVIDITEFRTAIIALSAMMSVVTLGQAALGASVGEHLEEEGQRTARLCYKLIYKLNRNMKNESDNLIISELNFLLEQSKSRKISLHAGGFFQLNWGILGSITSTVATYSIVIIQFLLK